MMLNTKENKMACVFLTKTGKNDLVYQYASDHERHDIKSVANNDVILSLSKSFFKNRKLKEYETEKDTLDIVSIRVDSENYELFLKELISNLTKRIKNIDIEKWNDLDNGDAIDEADSLQEFLSLCTFLRRYHGLSKNKKYKDYTFYIIPPIKN